MAWIRLPDWPAFWTDTAFNRFGWVVEQRGINGKYRHRLFDDMLRPIGWADGPDPIAQKLRDAGLTINYRESK